MTRPDDATLRQLRAADPGRSTWLSANAGSGKTRVLTDRVARLLLNGVEPQRILCLTYTKAAASEMQNRLFKRLGEWAMLDDVALFKALHTLGVTKDLPEAELLNARTLFARAIETPGGLKIQTIHSFCGALLRRFPLEAGVSPQFSEIEDRAADLLRAEIVDEMAQGPDNQHVRNIARHYTGEDFIGLTSAIVSKRAAFSESFNIEALITALGHQPDLDEAAIVEAAFAPGDWQLIQDLRPLLASSGVKDRETAAALERVESIDIQGLLNVEEALLTKTDKTPKKNFLAKSLRTAHPDLAEAADGLMARVFAARDARLVLTCARQSADLHAFATRFLAMYQEAKTARAWLDFDDLIEKARALLSDSQVAAWVLFRIDGGIDHILVDEAQDTSPDQWDVIRKLAEEFSAGQGARTDIERTIFVVGDQKQSIYSFQGADPKAFDAMRNEFDGRLHDSGNALQQTSLDHSFRSSSAILGLVDTVFDQQPGFPATNQHIAFHDALPGRVDVWPILPKAEKPEDGAWYEPVDLKQESHHHRVLARFVATKMKDMLDGEALIPTAVKDGHVLGRKVKPSDFLILVRRRTGIFHELIRACKELDLPIAGADRLRVGAEVAVKDLGALLSFLAMPDDDLSLATALRSPLFGLSEDDLFKLANGRQKQTLWQVFRKDPDRFADAFETLKDLRDKVDFLRPYDLIERILTRHEGRKKLLGRLGRDAEDGIDALLSQALAYERNAVPSLTGFLVWMETDSLEIKRQIDSASNQIRIMTVHGAKGLEAPIVILPECEKRTQQERGNIEVLDGQGLWRPGGKDRPASLQSLVDQAKAAREEESLRLLYVALTRAEKWLIVAGSGDADEKAGTDWHSRINAAAAGGLPLNTPTGPGLRVEYGDWVDMTVVPDTPTTQTVENLESFFSSPAKRPGSRQKVISPSQLGGAKALPGQGMEESEALAYGTLVHHLLERLPQLTSNAGEALFAAEAERSGLRHHVAQSAWAEAQNVLSDPHLTHAFSQDALAEVAISAEINGHRLGGVIDRLIVSPDHVLAIDFKTNRVLPKKPEETPIGILRQMAAYADALSKIYPDRKIETAVLWTAGAKLIPLPHDIVTDLLQDTRYLDDRAGDT